MLNIMRENMIPLLLVIQHYLERAGEGLMRASVSTANDEALLNAFRTEERQVIEQYDPGQLKAAHGAYNFVSWVNNQVLKEPSYVGTVERAARGWAIVNAFDVRKFQLFLVVGNLGALRSLMRLKTFKERRRYIDAFVRQLTPDDHTAWKTHWMKLGFDVQREQAQRVIRLEIPRGQLWTTSAREVLVREGLVEDDEGRQDEGTARQCMAFLEEIAGYDVLHLPPPVGFSEAT